MKILKGQEKDWCDGHLDEQGNRVWLSWKRKLGRTNNVLDYKQGFRRPKRIRCPKCNRLLIPESINIEPLQFVPEIVYRIPIHKIPKPKRPKNKKIRKKRNKYFRNHRRF